MSPEDLSQYHEHYIQMPSRARLQQRLGMVAMDEVARSRLARLNAEHEGNPLSAENFVEVVEGNVEKHLSLSAERQPDKYTPEVLARERDILLRKMPKILTTIVSTERDRREVLWFWFGREYEEIHADEPIDMVKRSTYIEDNIKKILKPTLSRKEKLQHKKSQQLRQEMRPHTSARHNGRHPRHRGF